ncbi:uncharacterized protein LOC127734384 isoform X2 [Mytilus californianus]|uniref:uncharacterized protein LOC127734384 isoform X2 n=1 Tax=Mytilus californianus TaxID=6549 RepID=UPI00224840A6|nr:uncharacterized protein LOC127734384 isoform X2 [Mytilus californianus]
MAYRTLEREASFAFGSTSSCLDGVPFTISSQFQVPNKVRLQADFLRSPKHAREEYNFEIEEGVMKWAEERERAIERERQIQAQKRLEEEIQAGKVNSCPIRITQEESDSEPEDEWLKSKSQNTSFPGDPQNTAREKPKPPPRPPQPRGPVISNGILTPIPISSANNEKTVSGTSKPVDVTLFETEDNPFDMFERQTLNDLEELKNVFQCTNQTTSVTSTEPLDDTQQTFRNTSSQFIGNGQNAVTGNSQMSGDNYENIHFSNGQGPNGRCVSSGANINNAFSSSPEPTDNAGDYVTLKTEPEHPNKTSQMDLNKLPPVPPRRFLVSNDPLPPINYQSDRSAIANQPLQQMTVNSTNYGNFNSVEPNPFALDTFTNAHATEYENTNKPYFKPLDSDIPSYENIDIQSERVVFSKKSESSLSHESLLKTASKTNASSYVNVAPAAPFNDSSIRNAKSSPDIVKTVNGVENSSEVFDRAPFPLSKSPPYRPSSQQSWNKYSPLPSPSGASNNSSSTSDFASPSEVDPYLKLTPELQGVVNNLVGMGFSRPRVARAVENFGCDEKEIVDHLFSVDKMTEVGYDTYQSELALVLHKNDKQKAEAYLKIFKQFQELGFSGDRIKEALVKFENDGDKALDYLTT